MDITFAPDRILQRATLVLQLRRLPPTIQDFEEVAMLRTYTDGQYILFDVVISGRTFRSVVIPADATELHRGAAIRYAYDRAMEQERATRDAEERTRATVRAILSAV